MPDWVAACSQDAVDPEDGIRFDHGGRTFPVYRSPTMSISPPKVSARKKKFTSRMGW
jgi:hypothetical protein